MAVYLDHAATTPVTPAALAAYTGQIARGGNPSSLHAAGQAARRVLEDARESLAASLGAHPTEIVFTSGGTEADNLALKGLYWARRDGDPRRRRILCSSVEHHAVADTVEWLEAHEGAEAVWLPCDRAGVTSMDALRAELEQDPGSVALAALMWANNEVGTVQPVHEAVRLAAAHGVPVHADAVQAFGHLPVDFAGSGLATLAVSGHKLGAPVGTGALAVRRDVALTPLLHGGGQQRGLRSGTLDAAGAAAFAVAARDAVSRRPEEARRLAGLRDRLLAGIEREVPDAVVSGPAERGESAARLPGVAHVTFPGCEGDSLLFLLDMAGIATSTGSACTAGVPRPSHVLLAMGRSEEEARGSQRFSLGWNSTEADVDALLKAIGPAVEQARAAGMAGHPSRIETASTRGRR
ncbi:cysteine desulfurase [Sinomonas atrocyanea]|uniref:Cysteine desulfurase n=1 Tax=Sinomonas atrocyanea TaxID=37927 RepID=A0A127A1K8_9MICC|nr:cysteine desulfurase family protein [Sinomonas atrocyanea]AMM33319.1 cysteine desulfurase [Sinomonas atrocyanea]GEB64942.1 cysteine desulfurase [Sinomonas atrocyanea]GGG78208.1 cysteine desulfurase [Sinomonas atrocyanea]